MLHHSTGIPTKHHKIPFGQLPEKRYIEGIPYPTPPLSVNGTPMYLLLLIWMNKVVFFENPPPLFENP
jgi:hypothetical protein